MEGKIKAFCIEILKEQRGLTIFFDFDQANRSTHLHFFFLFRTLAVVIPNCNQLQVLKYKRINESNQIQSKNKLRCWQNQIFIFSKNNKLPRSSPPEKKL
jgi:hypothetical protein